MSLPGEEIDGSLAAGTRRAIDLRGGERIDDHALLARIRAALTMAVAIGRA